MYYLIILLFIQRLKATTEWFGDTRAYMNTQQQPPFYDIVYDESDCPYGLESIAIPEYVYFGEMIAAKSVREHSLCLQYCLETTRCKAVNYFESTGGKKGKRKRHFIVIWLMRPPVGWVRICSVTNSLFFLLDQKTGFCELLIETQYDNPRLMRPFKKATYYEKIKCRTEGEGEEEIEQQQQQLQGKDLFGRRLQEEKKEKNENIGKRTEINKLNNEKEKEKEEKKKIQQQGKGRGTANFAKKN
ncbi:hypothetical protein Mgra_00003611 [Meloidogyne graminicola]|uniref:Apple domain-containing protein n=1 Tax=Meloidogyne graminicola TaxID=189291 RepID=A0A8S9ZUD1_9BILA|nr:hypothetical protein Mgra_00003611 [Meloidogyne graminicola]